MNPPSERRARQRRCVWQGEGHPGHAGWEAKDGSEYTEEEIAFIKAMEEWMRRTRTKFPTFTDVLRVAKALGYRKVETQATDAIFMALGEKEE